jgi:hypothetical protein
MTVFIVCGVWCDCGFRGPLFYLDPGDLKLKRKYIISGKYT